MGGETRPYALAGAMVMQGGHSPTASNLPESNVACELQILGYFVEAAALSEYQSAFPPPVE